MSYRPSRHVGVDPEFTVILYRQCSGDGFRVVFRVSDCLKLALLERLGPTPRAPLARVGKQ